VVMVNLARVDRFLPAIMSVIYAGTPRRSFAYSRRSTGWQRSVTPLMARVRLKIQAAGETQILLAVAGIAAGPLKTCSRPGPSGKNIHQMCAQALSDSQGVH